MAGSGHLQMMEALVKEERALVCLGKDVGTSHQWWGEGLRRMG